MLDTGAECTVVFVNEKHYDELLKTDIVIPCNLITAGGLRESLKVKKAWSLEGVFLQSVYYCRGRNLIINGQVVDVLLGMDFIKAAGGLKVELLTKDASRYSVWFPKLSTIKFVCNGEREAVIVSRKSGDRALSVDLSISERRPVEYEGETGQTVDEPHCFVVTEFEDSVELAIPEGSCVLRTISFPDFIMKEVLLPYGLNRRFVVEWIWSQGSPPEFKKIPC